MIAVPFSLRRALLIAQNTLLEALRQKLFTFVVLLAGALVLGARWLRDFNFGAPELRFLADCGFGALAFFGAALTIAAAAQLFFAEIENRTVLTLLAKPVWRTEFILGKYLGVVALVALFCALMTGLLMAVLWSREQELMREMPEAFAQSGAVSYAGVALAGALQWLKLAVLAAFVLLVASFAQTQLFTVAIGFFILVIGHLQYLAQETYARGVSSVAEALGMVLGSLVPNFQLFALADALAAGEQPGSYALRILLYAIGYIVVAGILAVFSFRHREI